MKQNPFVLLICCVSLLLTTTACSSQTEFENVSETAVDIAETTEGEKNMHRADGDTVLTATVTPNETQTLYLWESDLPPTFYAYGTEDPFYRQFMANAEAVREAGVEVEEHCYDGQPHGFGAGTKDSNWTPEFDRWFGNICANNGLEE